MTIFKRDVYDASDRSIHFTRVQDVEPILEDNKEFRETVARGDFKHKWNLPNIMVNKFYDEYCGGGYQPLNEEFWAWVDRKIMSDPDLKAFRTNNVSNFRIGYK